MEAKLTAMGPHERQDGIERLRALFKRWGVVLDQSDEHALASWAAAKMTTTDLVSHMSPRLQALGSRHEQN